MWIYLARNFHLLWVWVALATCERRRVTEASIVTELEKDQDPVVQITVVQRRNPILILFTLALKICRFQFCFCLEKTRAQC